MANTIVGRVLTVGAAVNIACKSGATLTKRELVLDCSRYDTYTGEKRDNFPQLEFVGRNCSLLDSLAEGELVEVSFILAGRKYEKDGKDCYFTSITGYRVEPYQPTPHTVQAQPAAPQAARQQDTPAPPPLPATESQQLDADNLPF